MGDYIGAYHRVIKGITRILDPKPKTLIPNPETPRVIHWGPRSFVF